MDKDYSTASGEELREELQVLRSIVLKADSDLRTNIAGGTFDAVNKCFDKFSQHLLDYEVFGEVYLEEDLQDLKVVFNEARTSYHSFILGQVCFIRRSAELIRRDLCCDLTQNILPANLKTKVNSSVGRLK